MAFTCAKLNTEHLNIQEVNVCANTQQRGLGERKFDSILKINNYITNAELPTESQNTELIPNYILSLCCKMRCLQCAMESPELAGF